jgi:hypothetical protein
MNHYRRDSPLSRFNREAGGGPVAVDPELLDFIGRCLRRSRESDGAFDVTVGPLMKAWGFFRGRAGCPPRRGWPRRARPSAIGMSNWTRGPGPSASSCGATRQLKIYIPLSTAQKYFVGDAQKEAEALMRRSHRGISDFKIENIGQEILRVRKEVDKLIRNWNVVLASIAGISLLVGGIGIFSVMQISISERVYEIGLRKSIGATDPEIFGQFLIESVSLSLVGGLIGSLLGFGVTLMAGEACSRSAAPGPRRRLGITPCLPGPSLLDP